MTVSLLCLIGLPGSGKSTLVGNIKRLFREDFGRVLSFEYDNLICEDVYSVGLWKSSRRELLDKIENLANDAVMTKKNTVIILDDNFFYRSMRYEVYRVAKKLRLGFGQVFLNIPFDICCYRNDCREKSVSSEVIGKMKALLEPPNPESNSWERHSLVFTTSPIVEQIFILISNTWEDPCYYHPETTSYPPQENSLVHHADLALRKIVKDIISSSSRNELKGLTKDLAHMKKSILEDIKTNNITLPTTTPEDDVSSIFVAALKQYFSPLMKS